MATPFKIPDEVSGLRKSGVQQIPPWEFLDDDLVEYYHGRINIANPQEELTPFAIRRDIEILSCIEIKSRNICIIDGDGSSAYLNKEYFKDFESWMIRVVKDLVDHFGLPKYL